LYGFYSLVFREKRKTLTAILILEQKALLGFCSDMLEARALHTDTQLDWHLLQLVTFYTAQDYLLKLLGDYGLERAHVERVHILVNCLNGYD
jgi:hypothetical protein